MKKYQAVSGYIHRRIAGSDVLVSVGGNIANFNGYIEINETAAILWRKLSVSCQLNDLAALLEDHYGISQETAMEDVSEFIKMLQAHRMVEVI